jgi:SAM-dependent methyltransferase
LAPWDGAVYAANTGHHRAHDAAFLERFPVRRADRVVDVGCGSGDFTAIVAGLVPDGEVIGVEPQPSLLDVARGLARPNQRFVEARAQDLDQVLPDDGSVDAVFTRAVLQWVPAADWPGILRSAHRLLRPGGWLRIECGGAGNIPNIVPFVSEISARFGGPPAPWTFLDPGAVMELTEQAGFVLGDDGFVRSVAQRRPFTRETLTGWFRSQCYQGFEVGIDPALHDAFRAEVEGRLDELRRADGSFDITYVRDDVLVYRPSL